MENNRLMCLTILPVSQPLHLAVVVLTVGGVLRFVLLLCVTSCVFSSSDYLNHNDKNHDVNEAHILWRNVSLPTHNIVDYKYWLMVCACV